jgi:chromate transport protein ChrA
MSLARAFEGKTLLLAVGVPLFACFSLDYFKRPGVMNALALFCLATTMVGASASAVFVLPALAVVLALAHLLTAVADRRLALGMMPGYLAGMSYVVLYALFALTHGAAHLGLDSPANFGWPTDFAGHASFFFNPDLPVMPVALIVSSGLALWLLRGEQRRYLTLWIVLSVLLFLNPLVAPFLIEHMTSPNAYWRLFFIYPFPLTLGISASSAFTRMQGLAASWRIGAVSLVCAALLAGNLLLPGASIFQGRDVSVGRPGYKIPPLDLTHAQQVIAIAPEGPMLAPRDLAGLVVMLDSNDPQLRIRDSAERAWFSERGQLDEAELRISASNYLQGGADERLKSLQQLLQEYPEIRSVVARAAVYKQPQLQSLLAQFGFTHSRSAAGYVIAWR